ncbi:hypothetical protein [Shewanella maritima]|uniref:hypothetical protein n=1 Tax=Shewanella maritima TaxID=2520507 RepID=UPI0037370715
MITSLVGCGNDTPPSETAMLLSKAAPVVCTPEVFQRFEHAVTSGDGQGHGPDIGSDEWKSVIEFKLGVRGKAQLPDRNTDEWCAYIDKEILSNQIHSAN